MEEAGDLELSGVSSNSTINNDNGCAWTGWSPVIDWGPLCTDDDFRGLIESMMRVDDRGPLCADDDFRGLIESMMCEDSDDVFPASVTHMAYDPYWNSNPSSSSTNTGTPPAEEPGSSNGGGGEDDKGLRLVHLLMAAADALAGPHKSRELAQVILVRLKELVSPAGSAARWGGGTNMERLAKYFTDALQGLLEGSSAAACGRQSASHRDDHPAGDVLAAFQLLQDMSPYAKFGHFTANQAILEAVAGDRRLHIVDYDIAEGVQWASLMQALVSRKDGPPPPHLRITAVTRGGGGTRAVQETGRRLAAFAASLGQPFSFGQCRLDADERFRPAGVRVVKGEAVVVNCVLQPPHAAAATTRGTGSVASFLSGAATLGARVVAVVEEEGVEEEGDFVGRFMGELHRYSAVWDSLEAGFPMQGQARGLVERVILGPRIAGAVRRAYRAIGGGGWGEWMARMEFGRVGISCFNHCQARLLLGLFNDGYRVEEDGSNKLVLGWKSRRLTSASIWSPPPPPAPAALLPASDVSNGMEDFDFLLEY